MIYKPEQVVLMKKQEERTDGRKYQKRIVKILEDNNYILTIRHINHDNSISMYQTDFVRWKSSLIKEILMIEENIYELPEPILSRFEILDL